MEDEDEEEKENEEEKEADDDKEIRSKTGKKMEESRNLPPNVEALGMKKKILWTKEIMIYLKIILILNP